ncbi:hypothetical protein F4802DRAFT_175692 [Xylaria palmicola]|nr:hypothetical protein F4802DRAFT_175692 [Xylaria palmicola]
MYNSQLWTSAILVEPSSGTHPCHPFVPNPSDLETQVKQDARRGLSWGKLGLAQEMILERSGASPGCKQISSLGARRAACNCMPTSDRHRAEVHIWRCAAKIPIRSIGSRPIRALPESRHSIVVSTARCGRADKSSILFDDKLLAHPEARESDCVSFFLCVFFYWFGLSTEHCEYRSKTQTLMCSHGQIRTLE